MLFTIFNYFYKISKKVDYRETVIDKILVEIIKS